MSLAGKGMDHGRRSGRPAALVLGLLLAAPSLLLADARLDGLALLAAGDARRALESFEAWESDCSCAEAAFLSGRALFELERPESAVAAFERALERDPGYRPALFHLSLALERVGRYGEAADRMTEWLGATGGAASGDSLRSETDRRMRLNRERQRIAEYSVANPDPERLGDRVNSAADDYMPVLRLDQSALAFTSNRAGGRDRAGRGEVYREDFWTADRTGPGPRDWTPARLLEGALNGPESEGAGSLSGDGRRLVFSACERAEGLGDCDLYEARLGEGGWTAGRNLGAPVNGPSWDSHPALSADGLRLVFASDRPGGFGGSDLWLCTALEDGGWSEPRNLGPAINTVGEECGPFLHADGRSLYFSSDGHPGFGGLDIFFSRLGADGDWSEPANLGPPICTPEPDLGFTISADATQSYFSSRREGWPSLDLYRCAVPSCCRPDPAWLLSGRVVDAADGRPLEARLRLEPLAGNRPAWDELRSAADGSFAFPLTKGDFLLFASAPDHLFASWLVRSGEAGDGSAGQAILDLDGPEDSLLVELAPIEPGARAGIDHLLFDFDRASIRPESRPVLGQVLTLLQENPGLRIELHGHTDHIGTEDYNQSLSERRALAVRDWLLQQGVASNRLRARGFGESKPLEAGEDEAARQRNRRTEILVVGYGTSELSR